MTIDTLPSDGRTLLAGILADPADDAARLVFADYVQEHGARHWPDLIRAQCDPSRTTAKDRRRLLGKAFPALAAGADWPGPLRRENSRGARNAYMVGEDAETVTVWADFGSHFRHSACAVRRGFVAEVRMPLAEFLGGPCPRCGGDGHYPEHGYSSRRVVCVRCSRSGVVAGCAAAVFARHPVEAVRADDRMPHVCGAGAGWYRDGRGTIGGEAVNLPPDVWDDLAGFKRFEQREPSNAKWFETRDAAHAALSAVLVARGVATRTPPECGRCGGAGEVYGHSPDCRSRFCALAGGPDDCRGVVVPCGCGEDAE